MTQKKQKEYRRKQWKFTLLGHRMGMNRIRDELEDLSFDILNSEARDLIKERLNFNKNNREDTFKTISSELIKVLKKMILKRRSQERKNHFPYGEKCRIKRYHSSN